MYHIKDKLMIQVKFHVLIRLKPLNILVILPRGGAVVARRAHNPKVGGSNPSPATKKPVQGTGFSTIGLTNHSFLMKSVTRSIKPIEF